MPRGEIQRKIRGMALTTSILLLGLPAVQAGPAPTPTLTFPQIATGDGITLELNLANPGSRLETGVVVFRNDAGMELNLPVEGQPQPTSRVEFSIRPGGAKKIRFVPKPQEPVPQVGYALVYADSSDSALVGNVIFTVVGLFDVSIPDSPATTRGTLFVERSGGAINSGVALLNPGAQPLELSLELLNTDGLPVASATKTLGAGTKTSLFLSDLFGEIDHFIGNLRVSASSPFHLLGLRQRGNGALAALPVTTTRGPLGGSQLLYFIDSGVRLNGYSAVDLQTKTVWQLAEVDKATNKNLLRLTNSNRNQAVTLHFYYLNDQCRDFLDFLLVLKCGETMVFDPFDLPIPGTDWKTSNILFGYGLPADLMQSFPAAQFGAGRFILSIAAVGVSTDPNDTADILFPNEQQVLELGECGVTPFNTGGSDGFIKGNLHIYNARPMVFDYLSGAHKAEQGTCEGKLVEADGQFLGLSRFTRALVIAPTSSYGNPQLILPAPPNADLFNFMAAHDEEAANGKRLPVTYLLTWGSEPFRILDGTR